MVTPLIKHKIVKKRTAKFNKFQSDRFKRLQNVRTRPRCSKAEVKSLRGNFLLRCARPSVLTDDATPLSERERRLRDECVRP